MSRLPSGAPRGSNARIRILGVDQPEPVAARPRRLPILPALIVGLGLALGITLAMRPDDPQVAQPTARLSQPSPRIDVMATADHGAFVPRPQIARVMKAASHADLDSAARYAVRTAVDPPTGGQAQVVTPTPTRADTPATATSTTTTTTVVSAPADPTTTPVGPDAPPNPAVPSQIDAP